MKRLEIFRNKTSMLKLALILLGFIIAFIMGYIIASDQIAPTDPIATEPVLPVLQGYSLDLLEHLLELEYPLEPVCLLEFYTSPEYAPTSEPEPSEPSIDATDAAVFAQIFEQIFYEVVGQEIDFGESGLIVELDETTMVARGYRQDGWRSRTFAIFTNPCPSWSPTWYLMAVGSPWGWDFTPHITRSHQGRRDLENEVAIMRFYRLMDWSGPRREEWNKIAEFVNIEIRGANFPEQLIPLLRQHIGWNYWGGGRREISVRDMWFIDNRLFIDFDDIRIWDNLGTSGEFNITMTLFRTLASLSETEDISQVVFLYNGRELFYVGGHGVQMGRLPLDSEDALRWLGLIADE